jgi:hypothetical protein
MAALAEEHALARTELHRAVTTGDETLRSQALGRLADLQDIAARSLDVVSLEAGRVG